MLLERDAVKVGRLSHGQLTRNDGVGPGDAAAAFRGFGSESYGCLSQRRSTRPGRAEIDDSLGAQPCFVDLDPPLMSAQVEDAMQRSLE